MRRDTALAIATGVVVIAATLSLTRVFSESTWQGATWLAVLLSLGVAAGARRLGFGFFASLIGSAVGFTVFTYVTHLPAGPLVPGTEQWRQAVGLLQEGILQFREQPAPTAPLDGLVLIVTSSAWVVTFAAHELLVRWRKTLLGLVPPTVFWVVPLAVPLPPGRTWPQALPFVAAVLLVLLLESEADVAGWVRESSAPKLSRSGLLVGGGALALAALIPAALPGYGSDAWVDFTEGTEPRGYQPIVDVGDRLHLPSERDVLEVQSDRPLYLRLAALDTFDGITWRLGPAGSSSFTPQDAELFRATGPLPPEVPIAQSVQAQVGVTVLDLENIYVPSPYQPTQVLGPHQDEIIYSRDGGFLATGELVENEIQGDLRVGVREGFEYGIVAELPTPDYEALRSVEIDGGDPALTRYLQLPSDYPSLTDQARRIYEEAGARTAVDRAFALQDWFTGGAFEYSVDVPELRGDGALQSFVLDTRAGYCEYFATAMAVMLRATGIPARVSVGFLPGDLTVRADPAVGRNLDTYTVSTADAHAWTEVLFPGYGWVRFEPTPRSDGAVLRPTADELDPLLSQRELAQQGQQDAPEPEAETPDEQELLREQGQDRALERSGQPDAGAGGTGSSGLPSGLVLLALLAVAGTGLAVANHLHRGRLTAGTSGRGRLLTAQRRVLFEAQALGLRRRDAETVTETIRRWASEQRLDPVRAARFAALGQAAAFGGVVDDDDAYEAERLADQLIDQLRDSVTPRDRLLAPFRVPIQELSEVTRSAVGRGRELTRDLLDRDAPR